MARQYVRVRGVGGGRISTIRPSAPRLAPRLAARRVSNGKRKA